jgi:ABC-type multidrug transport system permease subunit
MKKNKGEEGLLCRSLATVKLALIVGVVISICPMLLALALVLLACFLVAFFACGVGFIIYKLFE